MGVSTSQEKENNARSDTDQREFYLSGEWHSVREAIKLFECDPLLYEPGSRYLYTTHGFTLLSAVLEAAECAALRRSAPASCARRASTWNE